MSHPREPGRPPYPGPQGPWRQPPVPGGPHDPHSPVQQPPGAGGPGYGTPPGPPPGGAPGTPGSPYPPPPGGRPPGGGGNAGLVLVIASVCVAVLVVIGGVGLWLLSGGGDVTASGGQGSDDSVQALYEGTWDGTLDQYDAAGGPMGTWSLTVEVGEETIAAEEYGLGGPEDGRCTWEISGAQGTGAQLTFGYTVADDPDCADNGDVVIEPSGGDSLDITVTGTLQDGSETESRGTLYRD
ncbi:hypothetical protein [Streptomonospora salina]|uniref:Uncharacterized protein n=1 Tax=Streptomonospora salina TaxID=104205 RepID=A0A841E883_9ACTN|nr:hypothetical protein [Streptomonospora salina]MBB5998694.1 hypothetical protein [Streptomonospora salina]